MTFEREISLRGLSKAEIEDIIDKLGYFREDYALEVIDRRDNSKHLSLDNSFHVSEPRTDEPEHNYVRVAGNGVLSRSRQSWFTQRLSLTSLEEL